MIHTVTIYRNESGSANGFDPTDARLRLAETFEFSVPAIFAGRDAVHAALDAASNREGRRPVRVGDVVIVDRAAWSFGAAGWSLISQSDLDAALRPTVSA